MKFDDIVSAMWNQYGEVDLKPLNDLNDRFEADLNDEYVDGKYDPNEDIYVIKFNEDDFNLLMHTLDDRYQELNRKFETVDTFTNRISWLNDLVSEAYHNLRYEDDPKVILQNLEVIEKAYKVLKMEKKQWLH